MISKAFKSIKTTYKCVIIGDSIYEDEYKKRIKKYAHRDPRIIFTGFLKRDEYEEIASHAVCYVESKNIGGTHPSLLEAMDLGICVIAKNIPEHTEVVEDNALLYKKDDLQTLTTQIEFVRIMRGKAKRFYLRELCCLKKNLPVAIFC
jgi:glycosyltransferase involved in cell wall biosynthesis